MSDSCITIYYPMPGRQLDLEAGIQAWMSWGGRLASEFAYELAPLDPETHLEPERVRLHRLDLRKISPLRLLAERYSLALTIKSLHCSMDTFLISYHLHQSEAHISWVCDPVFCCEENAVQWNLERLSFAKGANAPYIVSTFGVGFDKLRTRFIAEGDGYRLQLAKRDNWYRNQIKSIDVCEEIGGLQPQGTTDRSLYGLPLGYVRYTVNPMRPP
ncbi:hypothetical protein [Tuwongella immobilis]|uniref:Uncharacterized protein n=1 Tax=Tuwongella immobilis TaxID=692036 RepID=A0A6C2YK73_9BACT|nr:hypothetical protein [Tuwongella immobilis]VIP01826.1 unnamed protein product [Tuwongella immobilis]VTR99567.1 unnamed protein product [Tuwongella immobilis]